MRTFEQLEDNIAALDFVLEPELTQRLDEASAVSLGFSHDFFSPGACGEFYCRRDTD